MGDTRTDSGQFYPGGKVIPRQPVRPGGGSDADAVHYYAETRTDDQKAQARQNIGAAALGDIPILDRSMTTTEPTEDGHGLTKHGIWCWVKSLLPSWLTSNYAEPATVESVNRKYTKPSDGIPKSDLNANVQSSLNKADSASQPAHTHAQSQVTGLADALAAKRDKTDMAEYEQREMYMARDTSAGIDISVWGIEWNGSTVSFWCDVGQKTHITGEANSEVETGDFECRITIGSAGSIPSDPSWHADTVWGEESQWPFGPVQRGVFPTGKTIDTVEARNAAIANHHDDRKADEEVIEPEHWDFREQFAAQPAVFDSFEVVATNDAFTGDVYRHVLWGMSGTTRTRLGRGSIGYDTEADLAEETEITWEKSPIFRNTKTYLVPAVVKRVMRSGLDQDGVPLDPNVGDLFSESNTFTRYKMADVVGNALAVQTFNRLAVTDATAHDLSFPAVSSGRSRDFALRLEIGAGSYTPAVTFPSATYEGDDFPDITPDATNAKAWLLAFTENKANTWLVRVAELKTPTTPPPVAANS